MTSSDVMTTIYNHQSVICLLGMEINFRPLSIISFSFETQKIKLALFSSGVENIMWWVNTHPPDVLQENKLYGSKKIIKLTSP